MPSKLPRAVPLDQPTPWEYLGQLSSLSSLAITGPPDSAQTVTTTGRSFQNLHNLRDLELPAGLSQLVMHTILNALPALQSLSGEVISWASDPGQMTLTPQPRSLTELKAAWIEAAFMIDLQAVGVPLRRLTLSSGAMPLHRPTLPHVHDWLHPSDRQPQLTDASRFRWLPFSAVASIIASLPRLREVAVEELKRSNSPDHESQLNVNTSLVVVQPPLDARLLLADETLSGFTAREPARRA